MKRDMGLIRKVLAEIQSKNDLKLRPIVIADEEPWRVARHTAMLIEAGLIEGESLFGSDAEYPVVYVSDLTMAGHDFASSLTNENVWGSMKKSFSASELATLPLKVVQGVASEFLLKWALGKAGF